MKKIALGLIFWLALSCLGFADGIPSVYFNNQAAVPQSAIRVDSNGDCWVNSNYVPLTQADLTKLSNSTLNYQEFYQGNAFLDINMLAPFLNWQMNNSNGSITVTTPSYQPLTTTAPSGSTPSVVTNVPYSMSQSEIIQQQQAAINDYYDNEDDLPPYMYYDSGPDDGYYPNNNGHRVYNGGSVTAADLINNPAPGLMRAASDPNLQYSDQFSSPRADFTGGSSYHGGGGFHGGGGRR